MTLKIKKRNYTIAERMFLIIWTFYSASYFILGSEFGIEYNVSSLNRFSSYATILMQLFMLILLKRYKLSDFLKYAAVLALIFLVEVFNSEGSLLIFVLFVILAQYIDIDKLFRYDIFLKICILVIIVGMSVAGITSNYTAVINGNYKQSWGFSHPNVFTGYALIILLEWLCVRYKNMKWYEWLLVAGSAIVIMRIGGGRTSVYTFIVIFLLYIFVTLIPNLFFTKPVKVAFTVITPLMAALSFWVAYLYNQGNAMVVVLDEVLTNRIRFSAQYLKFYPLRLFGQKIEYVSSRTSHTTGVTAKILDNAYVRCALGWGVLFFVVFIIAYIVLFRKLLENRRIELALLCLFFVLLGFGETYMLRPIYNLSLLCLLGFRSEKESIAVLKELTSKKRYRWRICLKR
ncbi:MAG: hypothetical protein LUC94_14445 [Clostridiales bacterium]|nr:hypothetical protein [Clostridiales bacterium]